MPTQTDVRRIALAAALVAAACAQPPDFRRATPPEADRFARGYIALIGAGGIDSAAAMVAPTMPGYERVRPVLVELRPLLVGHPLDTARIIGVQVYNAHRMGQPTIVHANVTYEMQVPDGWLVTNVASFDSAGRRWVEGFSAAKMAHSLEAQGAFTLADKGPRHWVFLLATLATTLTSLGTAGFIATQRGMPRRWGWALLAVVAAGRWSINWASGATEAHLLQVLLFGGAFLRMAPAAPWVLSFGFPIGAMIALRRWREWKATPAAPVDGAPAPAPAIVP